MKLPETRTVVVTTRFEQKAGEATQDKSNERVYAYRFDIPGGPIVQGPYRADRPRMLTKIEVVEGRNTLSDRPYCHFEGVLLKKDGTPRGGAGSMAWVTDEFKAEVLEAHRRWPS